MIDRIIKEYKDGKISKEYHGDSFNVIDGDYLYSDEQCKQQEKHKHKLFEWMRHYWRPIMAMLYGLILFIDFVIRPIVNITYANNFSLAHTVQSVKELDPAVQIQAIDIASRNELWPQITSQEVHYVFLVLLGITAWTRGMEKTETIKKEGRNVPTRRDDKENNKTSRNQQSNRRRDDDEEELA